MHPLIVLTILLTACGHERLDFKLPDGGGIGGRDGARSLKSMDYAGSRSSSVDSLWDSAALDPRLLDGAGFGPGSVPAESGNGGTGDSANAGVGAQAQHYQRDPRGYPTGPGQLAPSCMEGESFDEVCGNDMDEDCDGTVDEYPGIGAPCRAGCGEGVYVCSTSTNALLCLGDQGCMNPVPAPCGDGLLGPDEQCDPNAPSEEPGLTCTLTCERPLFIRCIDARGIMHADRCDDLHTCNERLGACMPVIGPRQRRCPQIPIEGSAADDHFYPMLETEDGECWVTCSKSDQCPSLLSDCYMGFCAVPF